MLQLAGTVMVSLASVVNQLVTSATDRGDRLESDEQGRAVVVELKTGTSAPRKDELGRRPQLGVYQLAVLLGAFEQFGLSEPGGAELVQVGKTSGMTLEPKVQRRTHWPKTRSRAGPRSWSRPSRSAWRARSSRPGVNPGCRTCPVASCCQVSPEGEQVTP